MSEHRAGCPWAGDPQASRIDVECADCGVREEDARLSRPAGRESAHQLECALAGPCRATCNSLHDVREPLPACYQCERPCICRQLQERAERAVREYISVGVSAEGWRRTARAYVERAGAQTAPARRVPTPWTPELRSEYAAIYDAESRGMFLTERGLREEAGQ